ncbi:MAG TPA: DNA polymerase III subunit beta [Verrucomicrobiota bacterium]|nr:DNA polymerase III subunit beta [Verrucomicrobiales bacterium]HRI13082.1 DNA polymerase III subunit beta [Verrucomicrobiota bacterium]
MKLTIAKEQLIQGLQAVQNVVGSRTTLPILSNVLLVASDGRLELTATDLDVTIAGSVVATVLKPGKTTVPVKKFFGIARELNAPEIEIEVDERAVMSLRAGGSSYKINGLSGEEFPPIAAIKESRAVALPQEKLKAMLRKTSFAASSDEARYVLNGIFFSLKEHKVTLVATDGRRLAMTDEEAEVPTEAEADFIVPTKAINELNRLLLATGTVELRFSENQVAFTTFGEGTMGVLIQSKLVDGNYPNYRQVIPGECQERIMLNREELLGALRRAELMTSDKSNSVKLTFSRNQLAVTANTPEVGEAREELAINHKGKDLAIAFNPAYLMDPLKALDEDEVAFELIDELSPGVLKTMKPFLYVIMPMRMT